MPRVNSATSVSFPLAGTHDLVVYDTIAESQIVDDISVFSWLLYDT